MAKPVTKMVVAVVLIMGAVAGANACYHASTADDSSCIPANLYIGNRSSQECPYPSRGSVMPTLALLNDDRFLTPRVRDGINNNLMRSLVNDQGLSNGQRIDELFLATLSRYPTRAERSLAIEPFDMVGRIVGAEDLHWALMNKLDFLFHVAIQRGAHAFLCRLSSRWVR